MMRESKTYTITTGSSPYTIDLLELSAGDVNAGSHVKNIADFCFEMEGNDATATLKAKGPFSNSTFKTVTDGSFSIGGGYLSVRGFALAQLEITTTATKPFSINVTRQVQN